MKNGFGISANAVVPNPFFYGYWLNL